MGTDQLSAEEIYELMKEAFAYHFLNTRYLLMMAKRFLNPFSQNRKSRKSSVLSKIKSFIVNGSSMLDGQGINKSIISEELKNMKVEDLPIYSKKKTTEDIIQYIPRKKQPMKLHLQK